MIFGKWLKCDRFQWPSPVHSYPHGMAQEQAEIMLGVVSKSTEQTVSTALQETGDHAAMRLVASVEQFCDPVVLDGFPSIFVSFRGILWHFTWDDVYCNWFKVQPTKQQNTMYIYNDDSQSMGLLVQMSYSHVFTATLHLQKFGVRETNQLQVGKGW